MAIHGGVNNVSQSMGPHAGVGNVDRQIVRGYIGDTYGVARLIYSSGLLPPKYQLLDYITGTGTQYIDTGVTQSSDQMAMEITFKLSTNTYSYSGWLMGCWATDKGFTINVNANSGSNAKKMCIGLGKGYWRTSSAINTNQHTYKADMANLLAYMDGTSHTVSAFTRTINDLPIYIFFGKETGTGAKAKGNCYGAKIWDAGVLIHDYYPCYRKTDSEPGLYDTVGKTFLTNAGTGVFGIGAEI